MEKLYPIATAATRHLFVDPAIYQPFDIIDPYYSGERSSYIKPGKVPNLMQLCMPEGVYYSVTEEPNPDEIVINEVLFGMHCDDCWTVFRVNTNVKLEKRDQGNWGLNGVIGVSRRSIINIATGKTGIESGHQSNVTPIGADALNIDIVLNYSRSTRCLEFSGAGNYDNGKPQILGLIFDLTHKDSKSTTALFKSKPQEIIQTYRREIVA